MFCCSFVIPIPLSFIENLIFVVLFSVEIRFIENITSPFFGVNLIALLKRFVITCCNLVQSPITEYGKLLSGLYKKSISFSFATIANNSTICSKNVSKINSSFTIANLPLSIFEMSNTHLYLVSLI